MLVSGPYNAAADYSLGSFQDPYSLTNPTWRSAGDHVLMHLVTQPPIQFTCIEQGVVCEKIQTSSVEQKTQIAFNKKTRQAGDEAQDSVQQAHWPAAYLHETSSESILNLALNTKIRILNLLIIK